MDKLSENREEQVQILGTQKSNTEEKKENEEWITKSLLEFLDRLIDHNFHFSYL